VIPSVILGKGRSVLLQFFLCLTVTFVAVSVEDLLTLMMGTEPTAQMQTMTLWFQNPLVAGLYLSAPYLFMLHLDIRSRKCEKKEAPKEVEAIMLEESVPAEQTVNYSAESNGTSGTSNANLVFERKSKRKASILYGIAAICFVLALVTFWFDKVVLSTILTQSYKLLYIVMFTSLGFILMVLGRYETDVVKQG